MQFRPNKTIKVANMKTLFTSCFCVAVLFLLPVLVHAQEPLPVDVTVAHWQDYSKPVRISGVLENKSEQNLAFKVTGLVKQIKANEGQWVKSGQVLAALDLEEINAEVAKAQSVLDNAERNLQRFRSLQGQNALSIDQLQTAETQMDVARSDLTVAKFNQRHAVIRAPADGRILKRYIENNEMVSPGTPAFVFAPSQGGWVMRAGVTDRDIVRLNLGDTAEVSLDAYPGVVFSGQINELAARADASQTFGIELRVEEEPDTALLAGFVGFAQITPIQTQQVMLIPSMAMVRANRTEDIRKAGIHSEVEVFVLDDNNQAELRRLPLLSIEQGNLVIGAGLEEGERVVTTGASLLSEGRNVKLSAQAEPAEVQATLE